MAAVPCTADSPAQRCQSAPGARRVAQKGDRGSYCLGGSRLRLIRQMLTESLVLAFPRRRIGLTLAFWKLDFFPRSFHRMRGGNFPRDA